MKKNFAFQLAYQILSIIIPLITTPYIARVLEAEGVGIYSYTYAIANYFVLLGKLGIDMYGNRLIAMQKGDKKMVSKRFWEVFLVHLIFAVISMLFYGILIIFISENRLILLIQSIYIISQLFNINWLYFGLEQFKITVTRNFFIKIITLVCVFLFVRTKNDVWKYTCITAIGMAAGEGVMWLILPNYVMVYRPKWDEMKKHIKPLILFFIPVAASSIYTMMDKVFIKIFQNAEQVGYYENAEKIVSVGRTITVALGTVALPRASRLVAEKKQDILKNTIKKSFLMDVWFSTAFAYGIGAIARELVPFFLGNKFTESISLVYMLIPCIPCWSIANVFRTQYVIPKQKDKIYINSQIIAAVVNFMLNLICIPIMGTRGAAVGTVVAEVIVCIMMVIASKDVINIRQCGGAFLYFNFAGILMTLCIKRANFIAIGTICNLFLKILIGGSVYITLGIMGKIRIIKHKK